MLHSLHITPLSGLQRELSDSRGMLVHASAEAKKWKNNKLRRLIRNRATTGRHFSARSPHRELIISLGRAGC
jgi:hypothetical protein